MEGVSVGVISEAGCPGIADPGAEVVKTAHDKNLEVVPLVGPSSILLALMASGMNGQSFAFNGYLPIDKNDRKQALKFFEKKSKEEKQPNSLSKPHIEMINWWKKSFRYYNPTPFYV